LVDKKQGECLFLNPGAWVLGTLESVGPWAKFTVVNLRTIKLAATWWPPGDTDDGQCRRRS
ncbi:hypothetical protein, partial [Streptomyces sp. MBT33]|uniref:hypothetical protein n=1 Tax=Streptomyces sp. MBT33 TaxID=1488363 RepID=UPI001F1F9290